MLLIILLVLIFWVVVPGLLTGWMLRELGRNFLWGLIIGALFGPFGPFVALLFLSAIPFRKPPGRLHEWARGPRSFYIVPFVGRLHVSTAWSLAGVAIFLCFWVIGVLGFELYAARYRWPAPGAGRAVKPEANQQVAAAGGGVPLQFQESQNRAEPAPGGQTAAPGGPLLSGLAAQTGQAAPASGSTAAAPAQSGQTPTGAASNALAGGATPVSPTAAPPATTPPSPEAPPATPARPAAPSREVAVSEVVRGLSGHRVHVAVSGDAQTATLSVSGPTLTRQVGNQLVGRTRQSLKAAGIRIVVINNGPESWTYIL